MIVIHTADWHIGQTFYNHERYDEHRHFFSWLTQTLTDKQADVLLVTGDVFDSPNPPARAQRMYYAFLQDITRKLPHLQVVITAGNHDSAARLEAPNPLLENMNVWVVGSTHYGEHGLLPAVTGADAAAVDGVEADAVSAPDTASATAQSLVPDAVANALILPLRDKNGVAAYVVAVPYLRGCDFPSAPTHEEGVRQLYAALAEKAREMAQGKPIIMTGHLHVLGAMLSEKDRSERAVVGGMDCVSADVFPTGIAYGALGHLHRAQKVGGREEVRYSGAPIPMSFAEKHNHQSVVMVDLDTPTISLLPYEPLVPLWSVPEKAAPIEEVLSALNALPQGEISPTSPYIEIKVLMDGPDPSYKHKIQQVLQGKSVRLTAIVPVVPESSAAANEDEAYLATMAEGGQIPPLSIAQAVYRKKYGEEMPEDLQKRMSDVIKELEV